MECNLDPPMRKSNIFFSCICVFCYNAGLSFPSDRSEAVMIPLEEETINIIPAATALITLGVYKLAPVPPVSHTGHKDK